jgi:hypothetical protein
MSSGKSELNRLPATEPNHEAALSVPVGGLGSTAPTINSAPATTASGFVRTALAVMYAADTLAAPTAGAASTAPTARAGAAMPMAAPVAA